MPSPVRGEGGKKTDSSTSSIDWVGNSINEGLAVVETATREGPPIERGESFDDIEVVAGTSSQSNGSESAAFARSAKVMRSPVGGAKTQPGSRKETPTGEKRRLDAETNEQSVVQAGKEKQPRLDWYTRIANKVAALERTVIQAKLPSTKKEIGDQVTGLKRLMLELKLEIEHQHKLALAPQRPSITVAVSCSEMGTQTETPEAIKSQEEIRIIRSRIENGEPVPELIQQNWPTGAFRSTSVIKSGLNKCKEGVTRVIFCAPTHLGTNEHIQRLSAAFPLLRKLNEKTLPAGKQAIIRCQEAIEIDGKADQSGNDTIIVSSLESAEPLDILDAVKRCTAEVHKNGGLKMVAVFPEKLDLNICRKITEIVLNNKLLKADIYASKGQRKEHTAKTSGDRGSRPTTKTVFLRPTAEGAQTYAEILADLKTKVQPKENGVDIHSCTKTEGGNVKLVMRERTAKGAAEFLKKVRATMGDRISCQTKKATIIIDSIEEGATIADVGHALCETLDCKAEDIELPKAFVKNVRGRLMAFASLEEGLARKAARLRYLPLQWTRAQMRLKVEPEFCSKCQKYGHRQNACKAERVAPRCRNCGETGHKVADCKGERTCLSCKEKGHRADSMACPIYRKLVEDKRKAC